MHGRMGMDTVERIDALLADPSTPRWVAEVIRVALTKDAVDAANAFEVLAEVFDARAASLGWQQSGR